MTPHTHIVDISSCTRTSQTYLATFFEEEMSDLFGLLFERPIGHPLEGSDQLWLHNGKQINK